MDAADDVRPRQHQEVVVALQLLGMTRETLATKVALVELEGLDHRAHRAVEHEHALLGEALDELLCFGEVGHFRAGIVASRRGPWMVRLDRHLSKGGWAVLWASGPPPP